MTAESLAELVAQLQVPSDNEIDGAIKKQIAEWSKPPKSAEVMATIDACVFGSLASGFAIRVMRIIHSVLVQLEAGDVDVKLDSPDVAVALDKYEIIENNVTLVGAGSASRINRIAT